MSSSKLPCSFFISRSGTSGISVMTGSVPISPSSAMVMDLLLPTSDAEYFKGVPQ